jgi:sugar phosphate isomerase/epimerase
MKPISVQLYSLRDEVKDDFLAVLKRVADMGYAGVEPAGFHGMTPAEFRTTVEDLGMQVSSSHGPWANPDNVEEVIDTVGILGLDIACGGYGAQQFADMDAIKATAEEANSVAEKLAEHNIRFCLHNHWWEFEKIDGRIKYAIFKELAPLVNYEIDTYWAANFGANDPAEQLSHFKTQAPLLHIKDGPLVKDEAHVAVGSGKIDVPKVIAAADESVVRWLVVELDKCDTDMYTAVEESYKYLVGNGLAEGRKVVS